MLKTNLNKIICGVFDRSPLNKTDVAREVGLSKTFMSEITTGKRGEIKVFRAVQVLDALGYQLVVIPKGKRIPDGGEVVKLSESAE